MKVVSENNPDILEISCNFLKNGGVISFATDTVYGIACDASNENAVSKLFEIKKRDQEKPIAIFVKDLVTAKKIFLFDEVSEKIAEKFLPGGITLILQKKPNLPIKLASNLNPQNNSLGFRIVDDKFVTKLISKFSGILAVSSANLANHKPAKTAKDVKNYFFNSTLDLIIDGKSSKYSKSSTVIKIIDSKVEILRHGKITQKSINLVLNS